MGANKPLRSEELEKRVIVQCTARLGNHPTSPQCRRDAVDGKFCSQHVKKLKEVNYNSNKKTQRKVQKISENDTPGSAAMPPLDGHAFGMQRPNANSISNAKAASNAMELVKRLRDAGFGVGLGGGMQDGLASLLGAGAQRAQFTAAPPPVPSVPMGASNQPHADEEDGTYDNKSKGTGSADALEKDKGISLLLSAANNY